MRDPDGYFAHVRGRLAAFDDEAARTSARLEAEQRRPALLASTRARLAERLAATEALGSHVTALFEGFDRAGPSTDAHREPILSNLHYLHRDWGWTRETDEHARALELVTSVVTAPLGTTAVLGAGAGRLAYDLHLDRGGAVTLALDVDPLLVAASVRVVAGASIPFVEAPANPFDIEALSREWTLVAPRGPAEDLHVVVADALAPPLAEGAFDTVVTPWFIDQIVPDLRRFLGVLRSLLRPGGRWIFFGPLIYPASLAPSLRFTRQEMTELAELAGFTIERSVEGKLDFSRSPLTKNGRTERCFAFAASTGEPRSRTRDGRPAWLVLPWRPVPRPATWLGGEIRPAARAILDLVEGERSISDIASVLTKTLAKADLPTLEDAVRHCLAGHHPDAAA